MNIKTTIITFMKHTTGTYMQKLIEIHKNKYDYSIAVCVCTKMKNDIRII